MNGVRQRDLAAALGLSTGTVSRALRNDRRISAEVRARVQAEAERQGYAPNPLLSSWMEHIRRGSQVDTVRIAFIATGTVPDEPILQLYQEAAQRRAKELGFQMEVLEAWRRDMTQQRVLEIIHSRGIQGLLLAGPTWRPFIGGPEWNPFAVVILGQAHATLTAHRVSPFHFKNTQTAFTALHERGYRRIGLVLSRLEGFEAVDQRIGGFLQIQQDYTDSPQLPYLLTDKSWKSQIQQYLEAEKPDALLTESGRVREAVEAVGWRIPADIALAHLGLNAACGDWAGINPLSPRIAEIGIEALAMQLYHHQYGLFEHPQTTFLPGLWRDGVTVKP